MEPMVIKMLLSQKKTFANRTFLSNTTTTHTTTVFSITTTTTAATTTTTFTTVTILLVLFIEKSLQLGSFPTKTSFDQINYLCLLHTN